MSDCQFQKVTEISPLIQRQKGDGGGRGFWSYSAWKNNKSDLSGVIFSFSFSLDLLLQA